MNGFLNAYWSIIPLANQQELGIYPWRVSYKLADPVETEGLVGLDLETQVVHATVGASFGWATPFMFQF